MTQCPPGVQSVRVGIFIPTNVAENGIFHRLDKKILGGILVAMFTYKFNRSSRSNRRIIKESSAFGRWIARLLAYEENRFDEHEHRIRRLERKLKKSVQKK